MATPSLAVIRALRHLNWWVRFQMRPHYTSLRGGTTDG